MIDTSIDLQEFDEAFASAPGGNGDVADGSYAARICDVSLLRSKAGNPMLVWELRILGPESQGRMLTKRRAITEKTIPWVRKDLEICGVTLQKMSELSGQIHRMIDLEIEISKVTRNGDMSIYFSHLITPGGGSSAVTDDDLPF